jgi:hypothetical protein
MGATAFPRPIRRLSVLLACSVVGAAALVFPAGAAGAGNSNSSLNLDQCRNGTVAVPDDCDAGGWDNGNLNPQQAHYTEGQSAPYRLVMEDLPLGEPVTVTVEYDIKRGGKHAIDFLTHYDRLPDTDVNPTDGVTGVTGTTDTFAVPAPSSAGSPMAGQPAAAFNALPAGERQMSLFGGDITGVAYVSQGDLASTGSAATRISVTFVADSATAVLAWGGHIASSEYWGAGNSASGVSGSPYHMSVVDWTLGNVGNQDRSMQADVVLPSEPEAPAQLTVTKTVTNDDGGTGEIADFDLLVDGVERAWGTPISLPAGTYTVGEGPHEGYVSTISGDCAANGTVTLAGGQVKECVITNDDVDVIEAPGPDPEENPDPGDNPGGSGTDPGSNPTTDAEVESATQTNNNPAQPVQPAPVSTLATTGSPEAPATQPVPTLAAELPRTGAGIREQSLLAVVLLAGGLLSSALGRRRTRPRAV